MKKILITTGGLSSIGQTGGISSYTHDLASNLSKAGYHVVVYLIKENNDVMANNINYTLELYSIPDKYKKEEELIEKLYKDIKNLNPDIIINNDTSYIAGLWPVISTNIIKISVMHGFSRGLTLTNFGIVGKMASLNNEYLDNIICQNSRMVKDVIKKYKVPSNKVLHIPQSFINRGEVNITNNKSDLNIIFANGQNQKKGSDIMVKIAKLIKSINFKYKIRWCLSDGILDLQNDENIMFRGRLTRDQFVNDLQKSDIIIIPTKLDTGPMLVVEAMANGVVPICNNLEESAIPDIVQDGVNGFVIDNNNPKGYIEIINKLNKDRDLLMQIKKNAMKYYLNNMTEIQQVKNYESIFKKQEFRKNTDFSEKNMVFYHLKRTTHLPFYSLKRIILKVLYTLEIPLTKKNYANIHWFFK